MKLLLLLLFCFAGVQESYGQQLLFSYDGPWRLPATGSGVTQSQLGGDNIGELSGSPSGGSANFNTQGSYVQVPVPQGLKIISYAIRANGFSDFTGTFVVSASTNNGATFSPIRTIDGSSGVTRGIGSEKVFNNKLDSNVTHVRFTYSSRIGSQVILLDGIRVTPPKPEINVKQTSDIASGGAYSFGTTNLNSTNSRVFTIENLGIGPLNLTGNPKVVVSGTNAGDFTVNETNTAAIIQDADSELGNTTTFGISFRPTTFGSKTATVSISNDDSDENPYVFTVTGNGDIFAPVIATMTPTEGPVGTRIIMTGDYFANVIRVTFTGGSVANFRIISDNEIEIIVPAGAFSGPIKLDVQGKASSSQTFTVLYDVPTIVSVSPGQGYIGTTVTILGTNFNEIQSVKFNGIAAGFTRISSAEIRVSVPEGATSGYVTVETPAGKAESPEVFVVLYAVPTITELDPTEGYIEDIIVIKGANLSNVQGVWFNGVEALFEEVSDTELMAMVPEGATTGFVTVQTTAGTATSSIEFVVLRLEPVITLLNPSEAYVGDIITITGENFTVPIRIFFNGVEATGFIVDNQNQIRVVVPEGATTGYITIESSQGTGTSSEEFVVLQPVEPALIPTIITLEPYEGYVEDIIVIRGENLSNVQGVWFNGVEALFEEVSDTELMAMVPEGATTGFVTVQTTEGTGSSPEQFVVLQLLPSIVSFDPTEGRVGTIVTISGENFGNVESVLFNGLTAEFISISETQVSAQVPAGASTGPITVITGSGSAISEEDFTVLPSPTIIISQNEMSLTTALGTSILGMYTVEASNLLVGANVVVDVNGLPGDYAISRTGEDGTFVKILTFEPGVDIFDNTLNMQELYVRFTPSVSGASSVMITHSSEGATTEVLTVNGSTPTIPLPVELTDFKARKQNNGVLLTWATASELDNDFFEVQMSDRANGDFKAIGQVKSRVNTTSIRQEYQFEHNGGFVGTRYYRLKQVDLDGTSEFSKVVAVTSNEAALTAGARVYPNPVNPTSKLEFTAPEAGKLNVTIVNMSGSRIQSMSYDVEAGRTTLELNLSNSLPTGMYILTTEFNGKTEQVKLLKN